MTDPITTPEQMREAAAKAVKRECSRRFQFDLAEVLPAAIRALPIAPQPDYRLAPHLQHIVEAAKTAPQWDTVNDRMAPQSVAVTIKPLPHGAEELDAALAEYTPGIDRAVRFVTIDQVDALAEFYLQNRNATPARDVRAAALREAAAECYRLSESYSGSCSSYSEDDPEIRKIKWAGVAAALAAENILALIDKEPQP